MSPDVSSLARAALMRRTIRVATVKGSIGARCLLLPSIAGIKGTQALLLRAFRRSCQGLALSFAVAASRRWLARVYRPATMDR